jgi:hypothetical protein
MTIVSDFASALSTYSNIRAYRFDSFTVDQICIIPGGGKNNLVSSDDGSGENDIPEPRVQIQVRDADLATSEDRAYEILALLHRGTVDGCISVTWDGRPPDYWTDENSLHIFSVEFTCLRSGGI